MSITTTSFAFMLIVLFVFYICRKELRLYVLSIASVLYAFYIGKHTAICILVIVIMSYVGAILIEHIKSKIVTLCIFILSISFMAGSLVYFKYFNSTLLVVGYSFFCFQAIGYLVDVRRDLLKPIYHPVRLLLFFAWFPKLVSGPIERAGQFDAQVKQIQEVSLLDEGRLKKSVSYIFVGCFYKLVLADRIAPIVDGIFDMPHIYQSWILIVGIFLYTIQIYGDFAGYSMIAIGVSNLFGINLIENFCSPYLSTSITEFWKRWHISLTNWLRDYIYIPLGGNRRGVYRRYLNLLIVFVVSGLWHGNGVGFLIWGILHGMLSILDKIIPMKNKIIGWMLTFVSVAFAWMFFKAASWERITAYVEAFIANNRAFPISAQLTQLGVYYLEVIIGAIAFVIMVLIDFCIKRYGSLEHLMNRIPLVVWCIFMWIMIISVAVFGIYGPSFESGKMIYMQF